MPDNNKDEVDIKRHELGPGYKAIAYFLILMITVGATWYVCKSNTKGEIAQSEVDIKKTDNTEAMRLKGIHDKNVAAKKKEHSKNVYTQDWANKPLRDLRPKRVLNSEEHKPW